LPLRDYGCDFFPFGEREFTDLIFCGKCAADFCDEEDYHSEILKSNSEKIIVESRELESLVEVFPLSA